MSLRRDLALLPREAWILFAATLVNRVGMMAMPFLVLYLTRKLGFSAGAAGSILAVFGVTALGTSPLAGRLADAVGTHRILVVSLLLSGSLLLVYPLARGWWGVAGVTVLWAAANELFRPASLSSISQLVPPEGRRTAFSVNRLAINLGMSIGPAAGGFLAGSSFLWLFIADGATSLAAAGLLLTARRGAFPGRAVEVQAAGRATAFRDRRLLAFLVALLPVALVFFQHSSTMALYLVRDLGLSERTYGLLFSLNTLLIVALEVPLSATASRFRHGRTLAVGSLLCGAGFGALALVRDAPGAAATVVVWTFGEMILLPASNSYVALLAPADRSGEYMGTYMMVFNLAFAAGPWLGTTVLEHRGAGVLWGGTLLCGILSALLFWPLVEPAGSEKIQASAP